MFIVKNEIHVIRSYFTRKFLKTLKCKKFIISNIYNTNSQTPIFAGEFDPQNDLEAFWDLLKSRGLNGTFCVVFECKADYEIYEKGLDSKGVGVVDFVKVGRTEFLKYIVRGV